jgi:hypothetical protein
MIVTPSARGTDGSNLLPSSGESSANRTRSRGGEAERQALVHPVIDTRMVVGKLLVAMGNAELVQPPHEPAGAVEQVELILLATVDVERLQATEIVGLSNSRHAS